jgi:thymidylate synthase ThyX
MSRRVLTVGPMPPEKCAYALARYSRSPDSIRESIEWVRTHDSRKFLESFYFQYGHASIADLGHVVMCFEGISELAAAEVEDEQLWDGQARSSRYQDFSRSGVVTPPEFDEAQAAAYREAAGRLIDGYQQVHGRVAEYLAERLPRPEEMKADAYRRNIAARAFDVARYLLPFGIPTGVGQVTSIRTLERQVRRLKASEYGELRELAEEIGEACASEPACAWSDGENEAVAPTLARHVDTDEYTVRMRGDLRAWAQANLPAMETVECGAVDLIRPEDTQADIAATLLYPVTKLPYRQLYELACGWSAAMRNEVVDAALLSRSKRDELPRAFRGGAFVFDITTDIGGWRDLHRHRRCQQFRQAFTSELGYATPAAIAEAGLGTIYDSLVLEALSVQAQLPRQGSHYLLPFGAKSRFLFKMDFAEAEYMARLRSGVKGHFSYRAVAWEMKQAMEREAPELGRLMQATPPWVEDPLER